MPTKQVINRQSIIFAEIGILILALLIRMIYFNQLQATFSGFLESKPFCGLDGNAYHNYALGFLNGAWPDADYAYAHMILYAYYLSFFYGLVGINLKLVVIIQILLEVVACAALYGIGRLAFNQSVGLMASFLLALYAPLVFFNACFAQVALSVPFFIVTVFLLLKTQITNRWGYLWFAGLLTGLAVLSRPTFILLVPISFLWWLLNRLSLKRLIGQTALYGGLVILVTLPATLHQIRAAGHFLPTPVSGWEILFIGNNPVAEGMGVLDHILYTYFDLPGEVYINNVTKIQQETHTAYRDEVLKFITTEPVKWLNLMGRKVYLLLGERDEYIISPYFVHNFQSTPLLPYLPFTWRSIFVGALLGMLLVKPSQYPVRVHRHLLLIILVAFTVFTLAFHIQYRFRLLFVPLILLYTSALIVAVPHLSRLRFRGGVVVLSLGYLFFPELGWLLALFIGFKLWPDLQNRNWSALRWPLLATWSYFVAAILASQIIAFATQTGQQQSIFLGPQVAGSVSLGQSFTVYCNGFNRISLVLGDYNNNHPHKVTFHLRTNRNSTEDIYQTTFDAIQITDRTRQHFTFPAQANSAGQPYFFFIEAPTATPNEAITIRGAYDQPVNRYLQGYAYAGWPGAWQELSADLAFKASCEANPLQITDQTFEKLAMDIGGTKLWYWGLLVIHGGLLLFALFRLRN